MYLDMLIWIIEFLLLNIDLVSVWVSFVFLILVGLRKIKELIGCLGFLSLVWVLCIVSEIVFIVVFCLIMCLCKSFFIFKSLFVFVFVSFVIGILV